MERHTVCLALIAMALVSAPAAGAAPATPHPAPPISQDPTAPAVDGIAAIVNGEVISVGQVARAEAMIRRGEVQGLLAGCGASGTVGETGVGGDPGKTALACLIDATLVFREVRRVSQVQVRPDDVEDAYRELVAEFGSEADLEAELHGFSLTPAATRRSLERQLMVARYIDRRFRATIEISEGAARRHYDEVMAPDMVAQGIEPPPFEQVDGDYVRPILREREVNRRVQSWILDLHARATIVQLRP